MIQNQQLAYSFFSIIFIIGLSFMTTQFLQKFLRILFPMTNNRLSLYWSIFLGLFFWVSVYAIICTKGLTMLLPIPVLVLWMIKTLSSAHQNQNTARKSFTAEFIFLLSALVVQFCFFAYTLCSTDPNIVHYISGDFSIYYRMADRLNSFGVEAYNFNLNEKVSLPSAYHFGDLWFYAMIQKWIDVNPSITFLVSFTILSITFTMGIYSYITKLFAQLLAPKHFIIYLLLFSGLFAGFSFCLPAFLRQYVEPYTLSVFNWGKVLVLSSALIGIIILIKDKLWRNVAVMTSLAGLLYINAIPAIFGAVFLIFLILLVKKEFSFTKWLFFQAIYIAITVGILLFLYKLVPIFFTSPVSRLANIHHTFLQGIPFGQYIKTSFNIFIGGWFQLFTISPYLLIAVLGLIYTKGIKQSFVLLKSIDFSVLFILFMFVSGLASWAVLYPLSVDTVQFFHNILAPVYAVAISVLVVYVTLNVSKIIFYLPIIAIALCSVYISTKNIFYTSTADKNEWLAMQDYFKNEKKSSPLINIRSMKELTYWSRRTDYYIPLNILSYEWHDYHNISLNAPFIPLSKISIYGFEEENDIAHSTFTTYYNDRKSKGVDDVAGSTLKFISDFGVKYISVSCDTIIPEYLKPFVKDSIVLKKSNYTIYKIH